MDVPSNAGDAVSALLATADVATNPDRVRGNPTRYELEGAPADPLDALTGRPPLPGNLGARVAAGARAGRAAMERDEGVVLDLPGVLLPVPVSRSVGSLMARDPAPDAIAAEHWGRYPYPVGKPLADKRLRDDQRVRRLVLAGPEISATPLGSWALVVSVLVARAVAADLSSWAGSMTRRDADAVRGEVAIYDAYADDAEQGIAASFTWLADLPERAPRPAFPTVPAVVRGVAVLGPM